MNTRLQFPHRAVLLVVGAVSAALGVERAVSHRDRRSVDFTRRLCPHIALRDYPCADAAHCERARPVPAAWARRIPQCLYVHIPGHTDRAMMRIEAPAVRMYRRPLW